MLLNKPKRDMAEINGSSMADIAFLLLIFFLVTTTINVDTGIGLVLPPPLDVDATPPPVKTRNMMHILVNAQGLVLMNEQPTQVVDVKQKLKDFIKNPERDPDLSESPQKAIVSIKTVRETPYRIYIDMLDQVMGAYAELRNEVSLSNYGRPYNTLGKEQRKIVGDMYPKKISIAEPDKDK